VKATLFVALTFVSLSLFFGWVSAPQENKIVVSVPKHQIETPAKTPEKIIAKPQLTQKKEPKEIPVVDTQAQKNNKISEKKADPVEDTPTPQVIEKNSSETREGGDGNADNFSLHAGNSKYFKNYKFVGNSSSMIYHLTTCKDADKIKKENMVKLESKEDAKKKGYRACLHCHPDCIEQRP
jgi:hypothetical protein